MTSPKATAAVAALNVLPPLPLDMLRPFCGGETPSRFAMAQPFVRDGWCYATNGHVCVRVPAVGHPDADGKEFPPAWSLFEKFPDASAFDKEWPTEFGDGTKLKIGALKIGAHLIDPRYAQLIANLPNVRRRAGDRWNKPLPFIFGGGGQGLVMGLRY